MLYAVSIHQWVDHPLQWLDSRLLGLRPTYILTQIPSTFEHLEWFDLTIYSLAISFYIYIYISVAEPSSSFKYASCRHSRHLRCRPQSPEGLDGRQWTIRLDPKCQSLQHRLVRLYWWLALWLQSRCLLGNLNHEQLHGPYVSDTHEKAFSRC